MGLIRELITVLEVRTRENDAQIAQLKRNVAEKTSLITALEERVRLDSGRIDAIERALSRR